MKRVFVIFGVIFILVFVQTNYADAIEQTPDENLVMEQLKMLDTELLEKTIENIHQETEGFFPKLNVQEYVHSVLTGQKAFNLKEILNGIIKYIFKELIANSHLLIKLVLLAIICAFLQNISNAFENSGVAKLANIVCQFMIIGIAIQSFSIAASVGTNTINDMVHFMQALLPILLTLLVSTGGMGAATVLQPVIIASVEIVSTFMKNIIMPLLFFSVVLAVVNNLSSKIHISKLSSLLKQICIVLIGLALTVFTGIVTIQGAVASTADGVALQTARFAADTFIPIVGSFVSDAFDTIMGYSLLLKNAVGSLGLILLILIVITPLLKILSFILIYKLATALIEPIVDDSLINCLENMSSAMILLFATVLSVAIMFFITMTTLIGASNMVMMIR